MARVSIRGLWLLAAVAASFAVLAATAARPAQACPVTPVSSSPDHSVWQCVISGPQPMVCTTPHTYQDVHYDANIQSWARNPTFTVLFNGTAVGPGNSPCPNETAGTPAATAFPDPSPVGPPGSGELPFGIIWRQTNNSNTDDSATTPNLTITVTYAGLPAICFSANPLNLGNAAVGASVTGTLTITNCGHADLVIGTIMMPGPPFSTAADGCSNVTLQPFAPENTCQLSLRFTPTAPGAAQSMITVHDNDSTAATQQVTVEGTGTPCTSNCPTGGGGTTCMASCTSGGGGSTCTSNCTGAGAGGSGGTGGTTCMANCTGQGGSTCTTACPHAACVADPRPPALVALEDELAQVDADARDIARLRAAIRRLKRTRRSTADTRAELAGIVRDLQMTVRRLPRRAADAAPRARLAGAAEIPASDVINGFAEATKQAIESKLNADHAAGKLSEKDLKTKLGQAKRLVDQLSTLGKLGSGEKLSDAEQEQVVQDALVGLVGEFAGKDAEEFAGKVGTLVKALRGKLSEKEKRKILDKEIPGLVEKLVKAAGAEKELAGSVKELTGQIVTLVKLAGGAELTDDERAQIFNQAVLGLLEKTVFNGWLNPLYLKAATAGYDFAKPFGDAIARGLRTAISRQVFSSAQVAILHKDETYVQTIGADHSVVIQTTIESGSFVGWIVTAYWDETARQVVLKALPGEDKAPLAKLRAGLRALIGSKDVEWVFDPTSCETEGKGNVLVGGP